MAKTSPRIPAKVKAARRVLRRAANSTPATRLAALKEIGSKYRTEKEEQTYKRLSRAVSPRAKNNPEYNYFAVRPLRTNEEETETSPAAQRREVFRMLEQYQNLDQRPETDVELENRYWGMFYRLRRIAKGKRR